MYRAEVNFAGNTFQHLISVINFHVLEHKDGQRKKTVKF